MDAAAHRGQRARAHERRARRSRESRKWNPQTRLGANAHGFMAFWTKVNNDWVFNLSSMLAYNLLMSIFPILLVLLAIAGFILGGLAPAQQASFESSLYHAFPGGQAVVTAVTTQLRHNAGILLVIGIVISAFTGSRLFIAVENCFGIIFRLRSRDVIHQNLMALGMLVLYVVLIPLVVLGSLVPSAILRALGNAATNPAVSVVTQLLGILVSVVFAFILLAAIYVVVPNRKVRLGEVWKGTLVAAALLVLYNLLFPFYESMLLHPSNYGSLAGFAIVILVFLYYFGFIVLIGAEVNSWASGQRETESDLPTTLYEAQAHDTTRGAAGPPAGQPQEDLRHHEAAAAMQDMTHAVRHEREDHQAAVKPPKPAEAHLPGRPQRTQEQVEQPWDEAAREAGVERGDGNPQQSEQPSADRSTAREA